MRTRSVPGLSCCTPECLSVSITILENYQNKKRKKEKKSIALRVQSSSSSLTTVAETESGLSKVQVHQSTSISLLRGLLPTSRTLQLFCGGSRRIQPSSKVCCLQTQKLSAFPKLEVGSSFTLSGFLKIRKTSRRGRSWIIRKVALKPWFTPIQVMPNSSS